MYINMAQGLYNGYYVAVDAYFVATPGATAAALAAGAPVPALVIPPTPAYVAAMTLSVAAALAAGFAVPTPLPPGVPYTPDVAMNGVLTTYTAEQLAYYADRVWEQPRVPLLRNVLPGGNLIQHEGWSLDIQPAVGAPLPPPLGYWRHIVYAYLLECTNLAPVMQRVVHEWVHGERLPYASQATQMWLRTTEQLFFTNPQPTSIRALTSDIRPDRASIRRNAYYRLLGMDLPPSFDARPHGYVKADAANRDFVRAWEQLMYEVWRAYMNITTTSGPNPTDPIALGELVRELREMLTARRAYGNLSREEFEAVNFFSWFHLTVLGNTIIVTDLAAQSTSPALRLKKIAERVSVPMHAKADSFFQLADNMADVLEAIETGALDGANTVLLYNPAIAGNFVGQMLMVITHWGATTGRSLKGTDVRALPAVQAPQQLPLMVPNTPRFQTVLR